MSENLFIFILMNGVWLVSALLTIIVDRLKHMYRISVYGVFESRKKYLHALFLEEWKGLLRSILVAWIIINGILASIMWFYWVWYVLIGLVSLILAIGGSHKLISGSIRLYQGIKSNLKGR